MSEQSQNLPAAAVSRQPCAHTRVIHALNCRSSRLNNEPNPNGGDFCPGFGICDCHVSEIERLQLAIRIAVEEIQAADCPDDCESNKDRCAVCGGEFDEHPVASDCGKPCEEFELNACNCWKSSALARIERAKDTGRTE